MSWLSISPSIVASFEYWQSVEDEERSERVHGELLSMIRGEPFEMPDRMRLGRLFHEVVEAPPDSTRHKGKRVYSVADDSGYSAAFAADDIDTFRSRHSPGTLREVRGVLDLPEIGVRMRARADGLDGNAVVEHKTTSRIRPDNYTESIQWRCYLLAFEARLVVYEVCRLSRDRSSGVWTIGEHASFEMYGYPGLRNDLRLRVGAVADFIRQMGLEQYRAETEEIATCP